MTGVFAKSDLFGAGLIAGAFLVDWRLGCVILAWLAAWRINSTLAEGDYPGAAWLVPAIFGIALLGLWELVVQLFGVPLVILPAPSDIAAKIGATTDLLWADFVQTFVKGALS